MFENKKMALVTALASSLPLNLDIAQKIKFSIKDFLSECDQILRKLLLSIFEKIWFSLG